MRPGLVDLTRWTGPLRVYGATDRVWAVVLRTPRRTRPLHLPSLGTVLWAASGLRRPARQPSNQARSRRDRRATPATSRSRLRNRQCAALRGRRQPRIAGVALTIGLAAVWQVVFSSDSPPAASSTAQQQHERATSLLRTVVGGGRTLFAPHRSFTRVSPSALRARSHNTPIVAPATKAHTGEVSMRVTSASVLTLATPADAQRCVFARDEPKRTGTEFVTVRTADCRAASAPARGWSSR